MATTHPATGKLTRQHRRVLAAAVVSCLALPALQASGAASPAPYQINVQKDPYWNGGEPEIAVNPRDPNNIVMVWAAMKISRTHTGPVDGVAIPGAIAQFTPLMGPNGTSCQMAVSFDRGRSWIGTRFPFGDQPSCGDPMVVTDRAGNFYVSFDSMGDYTLPQRYSYSAVDYTIVARSSDGGRSWSQPTDTRTFVDRPFTRVDAATGWVWVHSGGFGTPRKLTYSKDQARTWSPPVEVPGSHFAVGYGIFATAAFDASGQMTFNVSRDAGKSVTAIPVPGATGGSGGWVSADPRSKGGFAVMDQVGNIFRVFVTRDAGKTWRRAVSVSNDPGRTASKPWMDYGPTGVLGVMWRSAQSEGGTGVEVYATISRNGGLSFARPLKISSKPSPPANAADGAGDDLSWITVDRTDVLVGWGDRREGPTQTYLALVPFRAFGR
jgi:hypothetical protein